MATFDSATIVMMAENGHSVEIDGKKIQMTIVTDAKASEAKHSEVRVFDVPSEIEISYYLDSLNLHFGEHQALRYNKEKHCYAVMSSAKARDPFPCIATECKFEDLQEGDLVFATYRDEHDFTCLNQYVFLNDKKQAVWTDGKAVGIIEIKFYHYFKITAKP